MRKPELSIVILNYNTKDLLRNCLSSLEKVQKEVNFEMIVVDNGSADSSTKMVESEFPWVQLIRNNKNLGFAAGNNKARLHCAGRFILFLNSDTLVPKNTLRKVVDYLREHKKVGALTCKIVLPSGDLDKDARRSFITPWIGLVHIFLKLDRIFPKSRLFAKYWYGYISPDKTHEVDALQGAFFLVRKKILDGVNWFDEDYFLDGEDIDLSWRIKEVGWKIVYYPRVSIVHIKGATKGKNKKMKSKVPFKEKVKYRMSGVNSMEIFVRKRLWNRYSLPLILIVLLGIKVVKLVRFFKLLIFG
jgi:GT2 family glycosyltransferase